MKNSCTYSQRVCQLLVNAPGLVSNTGGKRRSAYCRKSVFRAAKWKSVLQLGQRCINHDFIQFQYDA